MSSELFNASICDLHHARKAFLLFNGGMDVVLGVAGG